MSSLIEKCYASGGGMIVDTIEAVEEGTSFAHLYCAGFDDRTCTTEDGRTLTFNAMALDIGLPANDNSGFQSIVVALDNTTGQPQEAIESARASEHRVTLTFRRYLIEDLSFPAERYRMTVLSREYDGDIAKLMCGLFDPLNTNGIRGVLTTTLAPGLKYI